MITIELKPELKPETEARLRALALERGETPENVAAARLDVAFLSDEEREEWEDELDLAAMRRARESSDPSDPSDRKTLDDLRAAMAERHK